MKRGLISILFISILFLNLVSAVTTPIHIKTPVNKQVQLSIIDNGNAVVERFIDFSDEYGDFYIDFSSSLSSFNIIVFLKQGNDNLMSPTKLVDVKAGEPVYIEMIPSGFTKVETPNITSTENAVNESEIVLNETEIIEINSTEILEIGEESLIKDFISGFSVLNDIDLKNKYTYYFFISFSGLIFILIAGFSTARIIRKSSKKKDDKEKKEEKVLANGEIKIKKLSELQKEMKEKENGSEKDKEIVQRIDELQKKIEELSKSLNEKNGESLEKKENKE